MHHGFAFPGWGYHFPSAISFKIAMSSVRSARARFSRVFSFPSCRSRDQTLGLTQVFDDFFRCVCLFFFMRVTTALRAAHSHNFWISFPGAIHPASII
jgi:hypothetical protein